MIFIGSHSSTAVIARFLGCIYKQDDEGEYVFAHLQIPRRLMQCSYFFGII